MIYYGYDFIRESDITHHGILGQKWGVRRFQNKDGTLTGAGKKRKQRLFQGEKKNPDTKLESHRKRSILIAAGTTVAAYILHDTGHEELAFKAAIVGLGLETVSAMLSDPRKARLSASELVSKTKKE